MVGLFLVIRLRPGLEIEIDIPQFRRNYLPGSFMKPGAFSLPENYSQRLKLLHKASLKPELLP
jgi:hypothetical protein